MKNMNKVLAGLMAAGLLLTTGCASTSTNSSSSTSDWYTGPGYDKLYEELGVLYILIHPIFFTGLKNKSFGLSIYP